MNTTSPEQQLEIFIDKFDAENAERIKAIGKVLRKRLPAANELAYDNYNFLAIGYCATERPSDCKMSLAADSNGVQLMFLNGTTLPDPQKLLRGSVKLNRALRVEGAEDLLRPEVLALIAASAAQSGIPETGKGKLIIRSISEKQRPRKKGRKTVTFGASAGEIAYFTTERAC